MSPTPGLYKFPEEITGSFDIEWTRAEKFDIWWYNYVKYPVRRLLSLRVKFYFTWDGDE